MDKADPAVLQALFSQPPAESIAYLESKGLRVTFNWAEMLDEAHARAFTVAKAMRLDVLQDIRSGVLDALTQGKTLRQFEQELTPLLQAKGWWGKQIVVDGQGQARQVQLGSPHRLKTIYQTNLQSAYMAGRMKSQQEADAFPYLMYVAVMDGRTRPSHAALNGKVWRKDDPVWSSIYPPNGFNCRCRTRALTTGQMTREGLSVADAPDVVTRDTAAGTDAATGEQFRTVQTGVRVQDAAGRPVTMWVDPGFNSSPLAGHPMDELLAQKAISALGDAAGFDLVRQAVLSETRMKAWRAFVDGAVKPGAPGLGASGQTMTAGILPLDTVKSLAADGRAFSPVLHVAEKTVSSSGGALEGALTGAEWTGLPGSLESATVYRDTVADTLVMVWEGDQTSAFTAVVERSGQIMAAGRNSLDSVESAIRGGRWVPAQ